ncbi:MAG TPA: helix-turn-helix transcriptional regulator [Acidimicrobiales bacterium]|nr:helix-turn-helix transcriptional regulator [Acidimicrobiales bacterium]
MSATAEHRAAEHRRRRANLVQHVHRSGSAGGVFDAASARLRQMVPFDAAAWLGTDPGTGLPTSPVRIDDLDAVTHSLCSAHWQHELLAEDVNVFRDLARADVPAAAFRATVGTDPERSPRYRRFLRPLGFGDELRTVLRVGDAPWGSITLWRREGSPPFTPPETATLAGLAAPIGEALRRHVRPTDTSAGGPGGHRPGMLLFDVAGELVSVDDEARHWLDQLAPEPGVPTDHGVLPLWMLITVFRAAAIGRGAGDGTARTRVRTQQGRWLACHASCLRGADGSTGDVAVVLEPAPPAAVAPLVVEAYDLTAREQEIVHLLARGAGTAAIADELFLSKHTVRDHVKAIFAKAGVTSRGELVAKLFAEFYEPAHADDVTRGRRL